MVPGSFSYSASGYGVCVGTDRLLKGSVCLYSLAHQLLLRAYAAFHPSAPLNGLTSLSCEGAEDFSTHRRCAERSLSCSVSML